MPDSTIGTALLTGLFGLALLLALWPTRRHAGRLLMRWGVAAPDEHDTAVGARYLRRRRLWYPWLFLALPFFPLPLGHFFTLGPLLAALLLGGLLAEVLAQRPARSSRREALLIPRTLLKLIPPWALVLAGVSSVASAADMFAREQWLELWVSGGIAVLCAGITILALTRPASGDASVDLALRTRSARVSAGLGVGAIALVGWSGDTVVSLVLFLFGMLCWLAIATPPKPIPVLARQG